MLYFAKSTNGFYDSEIHGANIPADCVEITAQQHADLLIGQATGSTITSDANGQPVLVAQTGMVEAQIVGAVQARLDSFAQTRNYDGILSACTYATSAVAKFRAEGQYCVDARDATWSAMYGILAAVQAGTRAMPSEFADIESSLPLLAWPT